MRALAFAGALSSILARPLGAAPFDKGGLLGQGAVAAGQGGAVVARADRLGALALGWNPAGLGKDHGFDLGGGLGSLLGGKAQQTHAGARGWWSDLELGYALGYDMSSIGSTLRSNESALLLGLGLPFSEDRRLRAGFTLKQYQLRLDLPGGEANGFGMDLGAQYTLPYLGDRLQLGLAVRDFQAGLQWATGLQADPTQLLQAGVAWDFDALTSAELDGELAVDPATPDRSTQGFRVGVERAIDFKRWGLPRALTLRLGYQQNNALAPAALGGIFSLGVGGQYRGLSLDYSFTQEVSALGEAHRFSGSYAWGAPGQRELRPEPTPKPTPIAQAPARPKIKVRASVDPGILDLGRRGAVANISLGLDGPLDAVASVRVVVINSLGDTVVAIRKDGPAAALRWDGRDAKSALAPEGAYQLLAQALDASGEALGAGETRINVMLQAGKLRLAPDSEIFAPAVQSARPQVSFGVAYDGADAREWTLSISRPGQPKPVRIIKGKGNPPVRIVWDGKDSTGKRVADGRYEAELAVQGSALSTAKTVVEADTRKPTLDLKAEPRVFEPRGESGSVTFEPAVVSSSGITVSWRLAIENLEGKALKTFNGKGAPPQTVVWNGVDESGTAVAREALYYAAFSITTESGAIARTPRLTLAAKLAAPTQPFKVPLQTVRFAVGDESVALEEYRALKEAVEAIKKYGAEYVLQVVGYADTTESNSSTVGGMELSLLRARAVRDYLISNESLDPEKVRAMGYGESSPVGDNNSDEGRARNRRVELILFTK